MEDQSRNLIFALDIGTRSIIGIVGHYRDERFCVEAFEQIQHPKRAMIDGQIEDIGQVARVAGEVKRRLEEKLQTRLRRVAVAAAGRALKTCNATQAAELSATPITAQQVFELENSAVNSARRQLDVGEEGTQYYCVGHSVVRYTIDGYPFTTLLNHSGKQASAEIIATFLPTEVVTSLRRCMDLIELDIDVLTLEPIAAMRAVLPADVRLLNLAMVDIGAGTADIALTRDGTATGYTMATMAGDEITEAIIRKCLVDFETAERIKLALEGGEEVQYIDILGHEQRMPTKDILNAIEVSVEMLAKVIADRIEEANGGPPMAVFLVGGGSRTPGLCAKVAEKLALESDKVALAGTNFSARVLEGAAELDSPEFATPVGIALTAADEEANGGASVEINGRRVRLYSGEACSVMDALLVAGYSYSDLMGRNGHSVTFTLNGERKVARGGPYTVAEISLGGRPASLTSPVENGDVLEIIPATSGKDAAPRIADYARGAAPLAVTLNGSGVKAGLLAFLNGQPVGPDTPIGEMDDVEISTLTTVGELCRSYGVTAMGDGLTRNRLPAQPDDLLQNGDAISTLGLAPANEAPAVAEKTAPPSPAAKPQVQQSKPHIPAEEAAGEQTLPPAPPLEEAPLPLEPAAPAPAAIFEAQMPRTEATTPKAPAQEWEGLAAGSTEDALAPKTEYSPQKEAPLPAETPAEAEEALVEAIEEQAKPPEAKGAKAEATEEKTEPPEAPKPYESPESSENPESPKSPECDASEADSAAPQEAEAHSSAPLPDISQPEPLPKSSLKIELNGRTVMLPPKAGGSSHFLLDMLPLVDIDPANPKGKVLIRRNGADAAYLDELMSGDRVEIRWEDENS